MARQTSVEIITAFRATSVVDTPMRKVEVLEGVDGAVLLRAVEFRAGRADVFTIHLDRHEAQTMGEILAKLANELEELRRKK